MEIKVTRNVLKANINASNHNQDYFKVSINRMYS